MKDRIITSNQELLDLVAMSSVIAITFLLIIVNLNTVKALEYPLITILFRHIIQHLSANLLVSGIIGLILMFTFDK